MTLSLFDYLTFKVPILQTGIILTCRNCYFLWSYLKYFQICDWFCLSCYNNVLPIECVESCQSLNFLVLQGEEWQHGQTLERTLSCQQVPSSPCPIYSRYKLKELSRVSFMGTLNPFVKPQLSRAILLHRLIFLTPSCFARVTPSLIMTDWTSSTWLISHVPDLTISAWQHHTQCDYFEHCDFLKGMMGQAS